MVVLRKRLRGCQAGAVLSSAALAAVGMAMVAVAAGPAPSFAPAVTYPNGATGPRQVVAADVDRDGYTDLVSTGPANDVSVRLGDGTGGFGAATTFPCGGTDPVSVAVADLNGDGAPDLLSANIGSNNLGVLLGNGSGSFGTAAVVPSGGSGPIYVDVANLNGDGSPDLICANLYSKTLGVLLGNGNGTFAAAATFGSGGYSPRTATAVDVNNDGRLDLVTANQNSSSVGVLLGDGNGAFGTATTFSGGGYRTPSAAVADVNGDHKPDIIAVNQFRNNVGVLLGNGDGTFGTAVVFNCGASEPRGVAVADVNGDGFPDLVTGNSYSDYNLAGVGVLLGDGSGSFGTATTFSSGGVRPFGVLAADLNGDGTPDVVVPNYNSKTLGVLLNTFNSSGNVAPVANGESYETSRATTLAVPAPGVLANDTDADANPLTAVLVSSPTGGSLALDANGSFRYTPRIGFTGADSFTYQAHDGTTSGNVATVTLNVSGKPPASTPDGKADAAGTIAVTGGNGTLALSARKTNGLVVGTLRYLDPSRNRSVTSTELTSIVVSGRQARVFGKGKLPSGTAVDFVVDVKDVGEPGRLRDTFRIEISNGQTVGGVLTAGNVNINR